MIMEFLFALAATFGCCILFNVPKRCMAFASLTGAIGWSAYQIFMQLGLTYIPAVFLAAVIIALIADILSRTLHDASTIFVIPGIIPLVPGAGMYYCMFYFINGDMDLAGQWAFKTLMIAGAIAIGLLVTGSIIRIGIQIKRKISAK